MITHIKGTRMQVHTLTLSASLGSLTPTDRVDCPQKPEMQGLSVTNPSSVPNNDFEFRLYYSF